LISPSKTFNIAGLPVSAAIIPDRDLRLRFRQTMEQLHLAIPNIFSIVAFESAYRHGENWLKQLLTYLEGNLNYAMSFFAVKIPQMKVIKPEGTYLLWLDCRGLGMNQEKLNDYMIRQAKVGLNDGRRFGIGGDGFLRLNMACPLPVLKDALERIEWAVRSLDAQG
jgi:cysteine-S-conjugate beta-lyase